MSATMADQFGFPKSRRLLTSDQFDAVFSHRMSRSDRSIVVYARRNGLEYPRLGLVVSRKCGGAVQRNRWKRCIREAFRRVQHELPRGLDLVIIPKSGATPEVEPLQRSIVALSRRLDEKLDSRSNN